MHNRLGVAAKALQISVDAPWKEVYMRRQPNASIPEGSAELQTWSSVDLISSPQICSKKIGCICTEGDELGRRASGDADLAGGCFSIRISATVVPSIMLFKSNTPADLSSDTICKAAFTFQICMDLTKVVDCRSKEYSGLKLCFVLLKTCLYVFPFIEEHGNLTQ